MDITKYELKHGNNIIHSEICNICLDIIDHDSDNIRLMCKHVYHKNCIIQYITHSITNNKKITCTHRNFFNENCQTILTIDDFTPLINDDLIQQYIHNTISHDNKCRLCPNCDKTFHIKNDNNWIATCSQCNIKMCFNCGKNHKKNISCFDNDIELKTSIDAYYKSSKHLLKKCPHCDLPQEKYSGCDSMVCGKNTEDKQLNIHGCGRSFIWTKAKKYIIKENYDIESGTYHNISDHDHNISYYNWKIFIFKAAILGIILLITSSILTYYSIKHIENINYVDKMQQLEKNSYCNNIFPDIENTYFLNTSCLTNMNMTIEKYSNEYSDIEFNEYYINCYYDLSSMYSDRCVDYEIFKLTDDNACDHNTFKEMYACKHLYNIGAPILLLLGSAVSLLLFIICCLVINKHTPFEFENIDYY